MSDEPRATTLFVVKHSVRLMDTVPPIYEFRMDLVFQHPDPDMETVVLEQLQHQVVSEGGHLKNEIIAALRDELTELENYKAKTEPELVRLREMEAALNRVATLALPPVIR